MPAINLMEKARDLGFQERTKFALMDVARDKAGTAADPSEELTFIGLILSGKINIHDIAVALAVVNTDILVADDAGLKTSIEQIWDFEVRAWT